jgi:hypothetical protein
VSTEVTDFWQRFISSDPLFHTFSIMVRYLPEIILTVSVEADTVREKCFGCLMALVLLGFVWAQGAAADNILLDPCAVEGQCRFFDGIVDIGLILPAGNARDLRIDATYYLTNDAVTQRGFDLDRQASPPSFSPSIVITTEGVQPLTVTLWGIGLITVAIVCRRILTNRERNRL